MDLVKEVCKADVKSQNIILATTLEKINTGLDKLEAKSKFKEVSEAQPQDLSNRLQVAISNTAAEETYQYFNNMSIDLKLSS